MPAAAVIPAPMAYTNVVAVKKLVVGFLGAFLRSGPLVPLGVRTALILTDLSFGINLPIGVGGRVYFEKIRVFKTVV